MTAHGYDPRCGELAEVFLPDGTSRRKVAELAQHIQDTIEDWLRAGVDEAEENIAGGVQ